MSFTVENSIVPVSNGIYALNENEIASVGGAKISAAAYLSYMAIGAVAVGVGVATGGTGLIIAGTFLGATAELIK